MTDTPNPSPHKRDVKKPSFWRGALEVIQADRRLLYLAWGFLVFFVITLLITLRAIQYEPSDFKSFWLSLTASFWEDLLFFLLLGGVAVLLTLNRPGDEGFENRVRYFFNGQRVTDGARNHISAEMKKLGIFSPRYKAVVTFTEYNKALDAMKATFQVDRTVVNMFKDQHFEEEDHEFILSPDALETEVRGELVDLYKGEGLNRIHLQNVPRPILEEGIRECVKLKLDRDEAVLFGYRAWMWFKVGQPYEVVPTRYTDTVEVRVVNDSGVNLSIASNESGDVTLTTGSERTYVKNKAPTGTRWIAFKLKGLSA